MSRGVRHARREFVAIDGESTRLVDALFFLRTHEQTSPLAEGTTPQDLLNPLFPTPSLPLTRTRQVCPETTYCPTGSSNTTTCPAGSYCPVETPEPIVCPRGYYCPLGSSEPVACVLGTYCPEGSEIFTSCPLGWYGSMTSNNTLWSRDDACAEVTLS